MDSALLEGIVANPTHMISFIERENEEAAAWLGEKLAVTFGSVNMFSGT